MADSSTLAMPSTTSPSPGMVWPASTTTMSPWLQLAARAPPRRGRRRRARPASSRPAGGRWCPSWPARSVAAWALPRPSATASARLANTTVSHSQTVIAQANTLGSAIARTVVKTEPISTMNITGLRHSVRRVELAQRVRQWTSTAAWGRAARRRPGAAGSAAACRASCAVGADVTDMSSFLMVVRAPPPAGRARARAGRSARRG